MHKVIQEMQRLNIDILGISDTRSSGTANFSTNNGMMYFPGNKTHSIDMVYAVIISKIMMQSVINFSPVSKFYCYNCIQKCKNIQMHTTAEKLDEQIQQFYEQINQVLKSIKPRDVTVIFGDLNSKIGEGKSEKNVGYRMLQFSQEHDIHFFNYSHQD